MWTPGKQRIEWTPYVGVIGFSRHRYCEVRVRLVVGQISQSALQVSDVLSGRTGEDLRRA